MTARITFTSLLTIIVTAGSAPPDVGSQTHLKQSVSIELHPRSATVDIREVPQGVVGFVASIKNEGTTTITIAHPSICLNADNKRAGEIDRNGFHGKSEILLKITKPDGSNILLRDGYLHYFDPDNAPVISIPPNGTGSFEVGWFFQNAKGRWEDNDEATKAFLVNGIYRVEILFRNVLPKAALFDEHTKSSVIANVWTGELKSDEVIIEVK